MLGGDRPLTNFLTFSQVSRYFLSVPIAFYIINQYYYVVFILINTFRNPYIYPKTPVMLGILLLRLPLNSIYRFYTQYANVTNHILLALNHKAAKIASLQLQIALSSMRIGYWKMLLRSWHVISRKVHVGIKLVISYSFTQLTGFFIYLLFDFGRCNFLVSIFPNCKFSSLYIAIWKRIFFLLIFCMMTLFVSAQERLFYSVSTTGRLSTGWSTSSLPVQFNKSNDCLQLNSGMVVYAGTRGTQSFVMTCRAVNNDSAIALAFFPNPTSSYSRLLSSSLLRNEQQLNISVIDVKGRVVIQQFRTAIDLFTGIIIDVQTLIPGSYFLHVKGRFYNEVIPFIKMN